MWPFSGHQALKGYSLTQDLHAKQSTQNWSTKNWKCLKYNAGLFKCPLEINSFPQRAQFQCLIFSCFQIYSKFTNLQRIEDT